MTDINTTIAKDIVWLKGHIVLLVIVIALAFGGVYGIETLVDKHDAEREAKDAQLLQLITGQTNDLKLRLAQDEEAMTKRDAEYNQIISQLSNTIAKQTQQLQQQIKVNATLSAQQTAEAISAKVQAQPGEVTAVGDNVSLNLAVSRTVNNSLDMLQTAQIQLDEKQKQLDAQASLTLDAVLDSANAKKVIASQDTQITQANKTCQDQIATINAKNRKSKLKWFGIGVVIGLVGARFAGI